MTLKKAGYRRRIIDDKIEKYMQAFSALSIEGPKWCGKTWTVLNHANSVVFFQDPKDGKSILEAARLSPLTVLSGQQPVAIDEWQEFPGIWDAVRHAVDMNPGVGQYLLTGSATPRRDTYSHSGIGRIARLKMRTMTLYEMGLSSGQVSLASLLAGEKQEPVLSKMASEKLIEIIVRGGWPSNILAEAEDAHLLANQYIDALVTTDISDLDNKRRRPELVERLLKSFARVTATTAGNNKIVADMLDHDATIARQTLSEYISSLMRLHIVEEIPQWFPELRSKLRLRKAPKRILADPSLAVAALGATPYSLARDGRTMGQLFENLCLHELLVYVDSIDGLLCHYRDSDELEIDAIVETRDGRWGGIEIKLGAHRVEEGANSLKRLSNKLTEKGVKSPEFLAVITGGGLCHQREDGIYVIPIDCLGPET